MNAKKLVNETHQILNSLCQELSLAESANDPYPIDGEYKDYILELGGGCLERNYDGWSYNLPSSLSQCKLLVDNYNNK